MDVTMIRQSIVGSLTMGLTLILAGCGDPAAELTGNWRQTSGDYTNSTLSLNADGSGRYSVKGGVNYDIGNWSADGDRITITFQSNDGYDQDSVLAEYELATNVLTIDSATNYESMTGRWQRQ